MSDYQWVLPRISVGGLLKPSDIPQLTAEKIGYIIDVTSHDDSLFAGDIQVLFLNVDDDGTSKQTLFRDVVAPWFIERWFSNPAKRFNIHCDAGVNRGPSAAMFCLMLLGLSASAAERAIRTARFNNWAPGMGIGYRLDAIQAAEDLGFFVR